MNIEWKIFLETQGAKIDDNGVNQFAAVEDELKNTAAGPVIADLSHYGLIRASGEEAEAFLQNQFSNDVGLVTESQAQLSSYCSPKGRMLSSFLLFRRNDDYYFRLPRNVLEPTLKRLRMFILRTKVELDDASDAMLRFGFAGKDAKSILASVLEKVPASPYSVVSSDGLTVIQTPGPLPCYELYGDMENISNTWKRLARQANPVGRDRWSWLGIQAGIPEILAETIEAFVPQMANLAALDGVSFKKGCYPGQEVVARMHYLGKLKRRMYLAHTEGTVLPDPGAAIYTDKENEQNIGKVVTAQLAPQGGVDLLAVLQIASSTENLHLESHTGPTLEIRELPYTVTDEA